MTSLERSSMPKTQAYHCARDIFTTQNEERDSYPILILSVYPRANNATKIEIVNWKMKLQIFQLRDTIMTASLFRL